MILKRPGLTVPFPSGAVPCREPNMADETPPPPYDHAKWAFEVNRENAHRAHDANTAFHIYINQAATVVMRRVASL